MPCRVVSKEPTAGPSEPLRRQRTRAHPMLHATRTSRAISVVPRTCSAMRTVSRAVRRDRDPNRCFCAGWCREPFLLGPVQRRWACLAIVIQVTPRVGSEKYRIRISPRDHKQAQEGLNQALAARTAYRQIGGMTALSAPPPTRELLGRTPSGLRSHLIRGAKNRCGNPR